MSKAKWRLVFASAWNDDDSFDFEDDDSCDDEWDLNN